MKQYPVHTFLGLPLLGALLVLLALSPLQMAYAQAGSQFPDFVQLIEQNSAAVVSINTSGTPRPRGMEDLPIPEDSPFYDYFRRFFEDQQPPTPRRRTPASVGSGFIISSDGYILTNAHVVADSDTIIVGLNDRTELTATLIGADERSDVALIKVDASDLPTVNIGDSSTLKVGQWVLAIGSPFGFNYTATQGIISGLSRSLPGGNYVPFIQTDAAVNPGNSGGPLFNLAGEVIGINSQIYSRTGGYQGVSFAIPIEVAMDVVSQLRTSGRVVRGWLGVLIQEVTTELAESFGLDRPRGALVSQVIENSPAAKADLQAGDIIVAFNDVQVDASSDLPPLVARVRPGQDAAVTVIRGDQEQTLTVTIEELPENPRQLAITPAAPKANPFKIVVEPLSEEQLQEGLSGVLVQEVQEGPASEAGVQSGDIIQRINNQPIADMADFEQALNNLPAGKPVPVLIKRGEGSLFLALTVPE